MTLSAFVVTIITKTDSPDNVLPNAPLEIRNRLANGTSGTLASIFSDAAGANQITQTGATTDSLGQFIFYASPAPYNAVFDNNGTPVISAIDVGLTTVAFTSAIDRLNPDTLAIAIADSSLLEGDILDVAENESGQGGGAKWTVVLTSSVTPDTFGVRVSTGIPTLSLVYKPIDGIVVADAMRNSSVGDDLSFLAAIEFAQTNNHDKVISYRAWSIPLPARAQGIFSTFMTWNYSILIDGFNGEIDLSRASFDLQTNSVSESRATLFVLLNCSGKFKAPDVDGKLSQQFVGSAYVDDCILRVGGGCNNLHVEISKSLKDWKGHGVVTRNYGTQDGFVDVEAGVPKHIVFSGAGEISGMWQSGYVPITGFGITAWYLKATGCGSNLTFNSQQSTTGHNFHQEAVTNGSDDPFIKDIFFYECEAEGAREHGFMIHTAINNTRIIGGVSRNNGVNGARYEGFCNGLDVDGLVVEDNGSHGEFISLSTAGWLDVGTKDVAATIRSIRRRNGGDGVRDNSGGASLQISGYCGYNDESGVILATAATGDIKQVVRDIVIINNGVVPGNNHGLSAKSAICENVRIVNQDIAKYSQIPLLFTGDNPSMSGISISGESPSGFDFEHTLTVGLPRGGMGLDLVGDLVKLFDDVFVGGRFSNGTFDLPVGYKKYIVDRASAQFPIYRLDSITTRLIGFETVVDYIGIANNIELRTRNGVGTINGAGQPFLMQSATKYQITYEAGNMTAVVIP